MGNQFDWQFEEDPDERPGHKGRRRMVNGLVLFWVVAIIFTVLLVGIWNTAREKGEANTEDLVQSAQVVVDVQQRAMAENDGELFYSTQIGDSNWFVAQLLPENQAVNRAGLKISNAEAHGELIWANAVWQDEDQSLQRVLFFERRAGQLRQIATDPDYWGTTLQKATDWGALVYYAVDDPWTATITQYVDDIVAQICTGGCLEDSRPFTIEVRDDFVQTAEKKRIQIPSPRLLGLDAQAAPSDRFWQELSKRINNYLTPAVIRFAVLPVTARDSQTILAYENLARQFMELNPGITIEVVNLGAFPADLSSLAYEFDGVAMVPTEAMLAAGQVHDLTNYILSDPDFDQADFYEQIWQGSIWHDRSWFMPEAAAMQVMYYDKTAYRQAAYPEPSSRWTWEEMGQDISSIIADQPQQNELAWGFLDVSLDSLFSYAYNWNNQCSESATVFCQTPLTTENVAAALEWYSQMVKQPGQMPDLTGQLGEVFSSTQISAMESVIVEERQSLLLLNFQGSRRKAAVWVDSPVNYEFNLLLSPVGVVPFPGSDRFDGISPLLLRGSFISQFSERPVAVWQWLNFLSHQFPTSRLIPARPSVAAESGFWTNLPQPLGDVMRTAFPFTRPVTIEERGYLTWAQLTAVLTGEMSPQEAARNRVEIPWFANNSEQGTP